MRTLIWCEEYLSIFKKIKMNAQDMTDRETTGPFIACTDDGRLVRYTRALPRPVELSDLVHMFGRAQIVAMVDELRVVGTNGGERLQNFDRWDEWGCNPTQQH